MGPTGWSQKYADLTAGYRFSENFAAQIVAYNYVGPSYITYQPMAVWTQGPWTLSGAFRGDTQATPDWQVEVFGKYLMTPGNWLQCWVIYDSNIDRSTSSSVNMNACRINTDYILSF